MCRRRYEKAKRTHFLFKFYFDTDELIDYESFSEMEADKNII
jgi:hypothetical protein